jgi:hypothetical protein
MSRSFLTIRCVMAWEGLFPEGSVGGAFVPMSVITILLFNNTQRVLGCRCSSPDGRPADMAVTMPASLTISPGGGFNG